MPGYGEGRYGLGPYGIGEDRTLDFPEIVHETSLSGEFVLSSTVAAEYDLKRTVEASIDR
jgi:hypothetical protein